MRGETLVTTYTLAAWLRDALASRGWLTDAGQASREAERETKVKRSALNNILAGGGTPGVETYLALSECFGVRAVELMRISGFAVDDVDVLAPDEQRARALALKARLPGFDEIIDRLLALSPEHGDGVKALLVYLEALQPRNPPSPLNGQSH